MQQAELGKEVESLIGLMDIIAGGSEPPEDIIISYNKPNYSSLNLPYCSGWNLEFERALLHRKDATSRKKSRKLSGMFPVTIWSVFEQLILWSSRLETDFIPKITNFFSMNN